MNTEVPVQVTDLRMIGPKWRALYFATVGAFAGFLGSMAILGAEVIAARLMGFAPFMVLRFYATLHDGASALLMTNRNFLLDAIPMHLAFGSAIGAVFVLMVSKRNVQKFAAYLAAGVGFGLCVWFLNFYLLLSWIQPLFNGKALIVESIPWWVAATTHVVYGLTIALVSFPFRNDVRNG